jgi:hypothetical protein
MATQAENKQIADPVPTQLRLDANSLVLVRPSVWNKDSTPKQVGMGVPQEMTLQELATALGPLMPPVTP